MLIKQYTQENLIFNWHISNETSMNHTQKWKSLTFYAYCQSTQFELTNATSYQPSIVFLLMSAGSITGANVNFVILDLQPISAM